MKDGKISREEIEKEEPGTTIGIEYENIRLTKNSKGNYQWTFVIKDETLTDKTLKRMQEIDKKMRKMFL